MLPPVEPTADAYNELLPEETQLPPDGAKYCTYKLACCGFAT